MPLTLTAGDELFEQDDPAKSGYLIVSGCMRTVRLMEDGRRQVGAFLMAGDVLGFDAVMRYDYAAQAVSDTVLRRFPLTAVQTLAARDAGFAGWLWRQASATLGRTRAHMFLLGRKTACERVASFLAELRARDAQGWARTWIALPMTRADIADYLGLTVETVSRTLTQLRRARVIDVQPGRIQIRDQQRLCDLAGDVVDMAVAPPGPSRIPTHAMRITHNSTAIAHATA